MKRNLIIVCLLTILSVPAVKDLFKSGAYTSHDLTHHIVRTIQMDKILSQGQFPPRWTDELNYGYGYPLFLFNYPLPSMIATGIHHLGTDYIWSVKLTFVLPMMLSVIFAYICFTYLWRDRRAGWVSALFYLYAPIRFVNVYVSATFGNAVAFMFVPLIFYALIRGWRGEATKVATLAGAVSLAGLMLSHNIMALMFLPVIGLFFLLHPNRHSLFAIILGLGLASWFWLPATLEKRYLRYDTTLVGFYQTHFPTLKQLIRSPWGYGFSHPGTELDAMSFQIGLAHLLVVGISLVLILARRRLAKLKLAIFWLVIFGGSFLLMLEVSDPIWKIVPWLPYLQMPWRLLAVSVFAAATLAGWVVVNLPRKTLAAGLLSLAVIIANRNHWRINQVFDPGEGYYLAINNTTTMASEHLPQGANKFDDFPPAAAKLEFLSGEGEVIYQKNTARTVEAQITSKTKARVRFNQIYFPGWRYWFDGRPAEVTVEPARPLPQLAVAAGTHKFLARFTRTPERRVADIISLISLAWGVYYAFRGAGYLQRGVKS